MPYTDRLSEFSLYRRRSRQLSPPAMPALHCSASQAITADFGVLRSLSQTTLVSRTITALTAAAHRLVLWRVRLDVVGAAQWREPSVDCLSEIWLRVGLLGADHFLQNLAQPRFHRPVVPGGRARVIVPLSSGSILRIVSVVIPSLGSVRGHCMQGGRCSKRAPLKRRARWCAKGKR